MSVKKVSKEQQLAKYWENGINKVTGWNDVKMKTPSCYDATLRVLKPTTGNAFTTNHN